MSKFNRMVHLCCAHPGLEDIRHPSIRTHSLTLTPITPIPGLEHLTTMVRNILHATKMMKQKTHRWAAAGASDEAEERREDVGYSAKATPRLAPNLETV